MILGLIPQNSAELAEAVPIVTKHTQTSTMYTAAKSSAIQEVFHVYLNKFEIAIIHLFFKYSEIINLHLYIG